jgi:hypothetical protein
MRCSVGAIAAAAPLAFECAHCKPAGGSRTASAATAMADEDLTHAAAGQEEGRLGELGRSRAHGRRRLRGKGEDGGGIHHGMN